MPAATATPAIEIRIFTLADAFLILVELAMAALVGSGDVFSATPFEGLTDARLTGLSGMPFTMQARCRDRESDWGKRT